MALLLLGKTRLLKFTSRSELDPGTRCIDLGPALADNGKLVYWRFKWTGPVLQKSSTLVIGALREGIMKTKAKCMSPFSPAQRLARGRKSTLTGKSQKNSPGHRSEEHTSELQSLRH